jgi:hypothetical protein
LVLACGLVAAFAPLVRIADENAVAAAAPSR